MGFRFRERNPIWEVLFGSIVVSDRARSGSVWEGQSGLYHRRFIYHFFLVRSAPVV